MALIRFGEQRLVRPGRRVERALFQIMGVAEPAHYLHSQYLIRALDQLQPSNPAKILDAGCGSGDYSFYLARRYPDAQIVGIDIDPDLIETNRKHADLLELTNVQFEVGDLSELTYAAEFDLVVSIDVLEHIVKQEAALRNLAEALRPGGVGFYHIPTVREIPVPFSKHLGGFHAWAEDEHLAEDLTADGFTRRVTESGLEVTSTLHTFGRRTGELATSLFALTWERTLANKLLQGFLAPACRLLAMADMLQWDRPRYAVALHVRKP